MAVRLIGGWLLLLCLSASAWADSARKVSVSELLATPMAFLDQPLVVTGVVRSDLYGPTLCELPRQRKAGRSECIDLGGPDLPIPRGAGRYSGAVVVVEGYFSHLCYADVPPDSEVQYVVICIHRGGNGWLTAEAVRFVGAVIEPDDVPCATIACWPFEELAPGAPSAAGVDGLARKIALAWRKGDLAQMVALQLPSLRAETRWDFERPNQTAARRFLRPEFRHAPASVLEPGDGYRLFELTDPEDKTVYHQICYCVSGQCGEAWKKPFGPYAFQRHPLACFEVWRSPDGWTLLY